MNTDELTSGGIRTTDAEKKEFAAKSLEWNAGQPAILKKFPELKNAEGLNALRHVHSAGGSPAKDAATGGEGK